VPRDEDDLDQGWGSSDEEDRKTVVPPDTKKAPDTKKLPDEPPTKPKRGTPPVLRLDSSSQFERPDPSAVISRSGRAALLDLADSNDELMAVPEPSEALDMVAREADREGGPVSTSAPATAPVPPKSSSKLVDPVVDMRERFSLGDYSGALVVAESILEEDPNDPEALKCSESCRRVLEQMYTTRIGSLERIPFIAVPQEQLRWLNIDHRAGFVLSHVDGNCSLEQILDVSGMPTLDTLRILYELLQQRVIGFR
jgi:hypothetical protein